MAKRNLKLVKPGETTSAGAVRAKRKKAYQPPHLQAVTLEQAAQQLQVEEAAVPLTLKEATEAARFKALTSAKAAQQFMVRRIMSELEELDDNMSSAA